MKLAMFSEQGSTPRLGVVEGDGVVDVGAFDPTLPTTIQGVLDHDAIAAVAKAAVGASRVALDTVTLTAPITRPGKFLALGINYKAHVAEMLTRMPGFVPPSVQVWFNKQVTSITGPFDPVLKPLVSDMLDYEGELAFVIGRRCKHVSREDAPGVIAGYLVCNDVSVRDWQMASPTQTMGKSFDTHGPIGPWLVTPDEAGDVQNLRVRTWVNGELRQDYSTADMVYTCAEMVEHLSKAMTLEPGDLITTGTSVGNGVLRDPPVLLKQGDRVKVEIEGLGSIENEVVDETA